MTQNIKTIITEFIRSLPSGIPAIGPIYSRYLSALSGKEQKELLKFIMNEEKKQSKFFKNNSQSILGLKKQLELILKINNESNKIISKTYETTKEIKKILIEREKESLEKLQTRDITKEEIIGGLCSNNIQIKILATSLVGEYKIFDAYKFLIRNLELPHKDLKILTLYNLGRLGISNSFDDVIKYVTDKDENISSMAKECIRYLGFDVVNQKNFNTFLTWITGDDKELKTISIEFFETLSEKGEIDVNSIKDELLDIFHKENDFLLLEYTIRILGQIPGISKEIDFTKIIYNEKNHEKNKFVKSASCHVLLLEKKFNILFEYLKYLINSETEDDLHLQNVAECILEPTNPYYKKAKQLIIKYIEKKEKHGNYSFSNIRSLSGYKMDRIIIKKNALRKNKTEEDCTELQKNIEFNVLIKRVMEVGESIPLLIIEDFE